MWSSLRLGGAGLVRCETPHIKKKTLQQCACCGRSFQPEPRAAGRQRFCALTRCRKASRRLTKSRWMARPCNAFYNSGPEPLQRVRDWRKAHPGYWKRKPRQQTEPESIAILLTVLDEFALRNTCGALQIPWPPQLVVLLGLVARLQGTALRSTIAEEVRANMLAGYALLGIPYPYPEIAGTPS